MAGDVRTDIPATEVPRFPVLRLIWRADGTITLEDTTVDVPAGQEPRLAALLACAEHAQSRGGDQPAIRVIATDEVTDTTWPMAVTGDGDIVDLTAADEQENERPSRRGLSRRALFIAGGIAGAAALGGGGIATARLINGREEPEAAAPPPPPGNGDLVPVAVPDGYSSVAEWTVQVAANTQVFGLSDGRTLTIDPDNNDLRVHEPDTGTVQWRGTGYRNSLTVSEVSIDERPFLIALDNSGVLKLWPLDQGPKVSASDVDLPAREAILYTSGPAPAVALPTQSGYIFQGADGVELDIPVGYQIISATTDGKAVLLGERDWALVEPGQTEPEDPIELLLPSKKHSIEGGFMLGEDRLLVRIAGPDETTWALYATDASNAILTVEASRSGNMPAPEDLLHTPGRDVWSIEGVIATADTLEAVDANQTTSVTDSGVYVDDTAGPVLIDATSGEATTLPDDAIPPSVATPERAVILADKLDTPTAYTVKASS